MFLHICHLYPPHSLSLQDIKGGLCAAGLVSLRDEMAAPFNNKVEFLDIHIEPPIDIEQATDILSRTDGQGLCHVKIDQVQQGKSVVELHIVCANANIGSELIDACKCFTESCDQHPGTLSESQTVQQLNKRLTDSTNGKMLQDGSITNVLNDLCDPQTRACIRAIIRLFDKDASSQESIVEIFAQGGFNKQASTVVKRLAKEGKLFTKSYALVCNSCGVPILDFPSVEAAKKSLGKASSSKCKFCEKGNVEVTEVYSVTDAAYKGLQQGLWLENLVYNVVKPLSIFCRVGQVIDPFELDVVCVCYGRTTLIECKDTGFGQNDFINLDAKAREIGAYVIGIVTTHPIHENVVRFIDRNREQTGRTTFVVADIQDPTEISSHIEKEIARIREDYLSNVFACREGDIDYIYRQARRRAMLKRGL